MHSDRRTFLKTTLGAGALAAVVPGSFAAAPTGQAAPANKPSDAQLAAAAARPILKLDGIGSPVKIKTIEILRNGGVYMVRSTSTDGRVGIGVANAHAPHLHPILEKRIAPFFIGKDARDLEQLIDGVYVHSSNYKLAGLAFWTPVAWLEFSLLDMLGKIAGKHVSALFGGLIRDKIPIYVASGRRETTPEEEIALLKEVVAEFGAKAIKFKIGGRMSQNADSIPGRTEGLIRLAGENFSGKLTIHADSNGSYDAPTGIKYGKMLEDIGAFQYEEPCPFDWYDETRQVTDALTIKVSGGEQDTSARRFRWIIENRALDIVQPDCHYNGGYIRATRVARMAELAGMPITIHMSGAGTGNLDAANFSSFTPNIGPFMEFKPRGKPVTWHTPPPVAKDGFIPVPAGPGLGITIDPDFLEKAEVLAAIG